MKTIEIGNTLFQIKDYYCSQDDNYLSKTDAKLWLYVNITDVCPALCPFCVNPGRKDGRSTFDLQLFRNTLEKISPFIYGISFTGGEPMIEPELLDQTILSSAEIMDLKVELDLVTNGINLMEILDFKSLKYLDSIHLSRHRISDEENVNLMGVETPSRDLIKQFVSNLKDPGQLVLNCILSKDGISSVDSIAAYLDMASGLNVSNTSFIGLIKANEYCKRQYVDPTTINLKSDSRFRIWNCFHDHQYCCCTSGDYYTGERWVRFYYRAPGMEPAPYARQIVYTHENRLLQGFGGDEIQIET